MGYRPGKRLVNLSFEDHEGLEVRCKYPPLGELLHIQGLQVQLNEPDEEKKLELFSSFVRYLESWNVEHPDVKDDKPCRRCGLESGAPLPITVEGLLCLDLEFIMQIMFGWIFAVAQVSPPKGMNLINGENPLEALMKQLGELQNPGKSLMPNSS